MTTPLRHICLIHEGVPSVHLGLVAPFIMQGLKRGDRCLFLGSPEMVSLLQLSLSGSGLDVSGEARRGALLLISNLDHMNGTRFEPARMLARIEEAIWQAMNDGFKGLTGVGDIGWELGAEMNLSKVMEYESAVEKLFGKWPNFHGLCQYRQDKLPLRTLGSALLTHRGVSMHGMPARHNPYFSPPEPVLRTAPEDLEIRRMLDRLSTH